MVNIKTEGLFKNKNGEMSVEEFVKLIHTGEIDTWMRYHKLTTHKCPPEKLLRGRPETCFRCVSCQKYATSKVKEYKNYYQVGKERFLKEELDNDIES